MEKKLLRVLVVDDSPDDTELTVEVLRRAGYMLKTQRVQDIAGMQTALTKESWDVIITETDVPQFSVTLVLDTLRHAKQDSPCIVMTRTVSDADLTKLMHAGVRDIVFKNQASRLAPVIERELAVTQGRHQQQETQRTLTRLEQRYRALIDGSREAVCYSHDGIHTETNRAYLALFGYNDATELADVPVLSLIDKADHARLKDLFRKPGRSPQGAGGSEFVAIKKDGTRFPVEISISAIDMGGEIWHQITINDISKRKAMDSKLQFLQERDSLTGLYNRHYFVVELGKAVTAAKTKKGKSALLYIGLDQLKEINEAYGFTAGDKVLLKVARLLGANIENNDVLARYGGSEFAILLHGADETSARQVADKMRSTLKETSFSEANQTFECQCHFGIGAINANVESAEKTLAIAQRAFLTARTPHQQTKAELHVEAPPTPPPAATKPTPAPAPQAAPPAKVVENRSPIVSAIENALKGHGFQLLYQPIVNLHGDPAENYEVLVRMVSAEGNLVPAGEFMPAAEESKLALAIDHWVIRNAIKALRELRAKGHQATFFVNLSATALNDSDLPIVIVDALRDSGVKGHSLVFEVKDSSLAGHAKEAAAFISSLGKLGCRFAADDFGKRLGGAPLQQPLEFLKIDNSLVHNLLNEQGGNETVKEIFDSAVNDNRRIIIKNVEDAASLSALWNFGVEYVQGNYFQPPDATLNYNFAGESIDSDQATSGWTQVDR